MSEFVRSFVPLLHGGRRVGVVVMAYYDAPLYVRSVSAAAYALDGAPLVSGLACLLRQFHPSYLRQLLAYLGQV